MAIVTEPDDHLVDNNDERSDRQLENEIQLMVMVVQYVGEQTECGWLEKPLHKLTRFLNILVMNKVSKIYFWIK